MAPFDRAAVLIDAADYFERLEEALLRAQRSVLIVGWDFDGRIALRPRSGPQGRRPLSHLLRGLVEERPGLEVRILVWDYSVFYGQSAPKPLLMGADWQHHPRIHLRLDREHPLNASHHQKLVCIDDAVAFAGGMDLTVQRWDTPRHGMDDACRIDPDGAAYDPVHDLQMIVDGAVAGALADLIRRRWEDATGETLGPVEAPGDPWPPGLEPDFTNGSIGISRTVPPRKTAPAIREVAELTLDALGSAREAIYIEAQYLTAPAVGDCLADHLAADDGPEIVIVTSEDFHGVVERFVMGSNRDRLVRRLKSADRHHRLRAGSPVVPSAGGEQEILVHSKLLVVDDRFLRLGSSNLNNRSMGLDTECDLALEARDDETRRVIVRLRNRLIAEHLGTSVERLESVLAVERSLLRAVDGLNGGPRRLRPFRCLDGTGPTTTLPGTGLFDPDAPFEPLRILGRVWDR
ncbi:phospholipase D-like domain-containing protein [Skermanella rosea]|uniref:phospholipase D-like domain-containing protein n=1 Tax=Skermanella rosea TaxID=1817965 RepID=UPI001933F4A6|nr:phospholipase D-like domain-containing protein [Skermanella rosea]UEM01844.1 phospholipase D-like domain-containing protein [Skermanella rosea]